LPEGEDKGMQIYLWRHNRRLHSWSMLSEPVVHQDFYTDAVAVVQAASEDEALALLAARHPAWLVEELRRLRPQVFAAATPAVIFADIRGE
jgi:hypothetical protein